MQYIKTLLNKSKIVVFSFVLIATAIAPNIAATVKAASVSVIDTITMSDLGGQPALDPTGAASVQVNISQKPGQTLSAGDTFSLTLPASLSGLATSFSFSDGTTTYGSCTANTTQVLCTFNSAVDGKSNIVGQLTFTANVVTNQVTPNTTNTFPYLLNDGSTINVNEAVGSLPGPGDITVPHKTAFFPGTPGIISYTDILPYCQALTNINLVDTLGPGQELVPGSVQLRVTSTDRYGNACPSPPGYPEYPGSSAPTFPYTITEASDRSGFTLTAPAAPSGFLYAIYYDVQATANLAQYSNSFTLNTLELGAQATTVHINNSAGSGWATGIVPPSSSGNGGSTPPSSPIPVPGVPDTGFALQKASWSLPILLFTTSLLLICGGLRTKRNTPR